MNPFGESATCRKFRQVRAEGARQVARAIKNVFAEGELIPERVERVVRKFGNSEFSTKPTNLYNLDATI